jgi:hypothetical protein
MRLLTALLLAAPAVSAEPIWKDLFVHNAAQATVGYGYEMVGPGASFGLRAFGLEARFVPGANFDETISTGQGVEVHHADYHGASIGLSPLSIGTGSWGEKAGFEFTFLEPFALYCSGRLTKSNNGQAAHQDVTFAQLGSRLYATQHIGSGMAFRLGFEAAYGTLDWKAIPAPGTDATFGGPNIRLNFFAGFAMLLGVPK